MKSRIEELVNEVVDEVIEENVGFSAERIVLEEVRIRLLDRLAEEEQELPVEVVEGVRGNLRRGLEREPVPESTVLPPPPSRRRFLPREGVRMLCLEDDEEGRVCYLDLGHDGAHGFEAASDAG